MTRAERRAKRAKIAKAVRSGISVHAAAARFGVNLRYVYLCCKQEGVKFGRGGVGSRAQTAKRDRAIAQSAKRGEPAASIAKRLKMPEQTVRSACERQGVRPVEGTGSRHQRGLAKRREVKARLRTPLEILMPQSAPRTRRIVRLMLDTDWTMERIGKVCGVPRQRVNEVWKGGGANTPLHTSFESSYTW